MTPRIAITLGDVTGIGPEVLVRAWRSGDLLAAASPLIIGRADILQSELQRQNISTITIQAITHPAHANPSPTILPVLDVDSVDLSACRLGQIDPRAGRAANDFLVRAAELALSDQVDAIVTLPLHKEALRAAGIAEPGHTEILARLCGGVEHAMMLYVPPPTAAGRAGFGVVHATLHVALREVFDLLTTERVHAAIRLANAGLWPFTPDHPPRIGVAGLNPHAGEHGLFGREELEIIEPAVALAKEQGLDVHGPIAADTLFKAAFDGDYDAVVAMYHDQGHVAVKTRAFRHAVNVTLGLPIIRTSVAHGTAHDIAGRGMADPTSLIEATRVAARLASAARSRRAATR